MKTATCFVATVYPSYYDGGHWPMIMSLTTKYPSTTINSTNIDEVVRLSREWAEKFALPAHVSVTMANRGERKPRGFDEKTRRIRVNLTEENKAIDTMGKAFSEWEKHLPGAEAA